MEFIDSTGHIFSLTSFNSYPTGYEYETFDYVFYLEDEYVRRLSVNNFYIKPIRALLHKDSGNISSLSITNIKYTKGSMDKIHRALILVLLASLKYSHILQYSFH